MTPAEMLEIRGLFDAFTRQVRRGNLEEVREAQRLLLEAIERVEDPPYGVISAYNVLLSMNPTPEKLLQLRLRLDEDADPAPFEVMSRAAREAAHQYFEPFLTHERRFNIIGAGALAVSASVLTAALLEKAYWLLVPAYVMFALGKWAAGRAHRERDAAFVRTARALARNLAGDREPEH